MSAIAYYLALPFLYILSLMPFPVFYLVSDLVFVVFYYVIGYRKKVVLQNIRNSFPEETDKEIKKIRRAFYRHFSDLFMETFRTLTISKSSMLKRCVMTPESKAIFDRFASEDKSIILVMGHWGNWEWGGNTFSTLCRQQLYVIYHPLTNKHFGGLMYRMRTRFGTKLLPMKNAFREILAVKSELSATAFIADQTPQPHNAMWLTFLNQETPVFKGTEVIATKLNRPVVYVGIKKLRRGHYELHAEVLTEQPASLPEGALTIMHTRRLEQDIKAQPETWLWSHKRWKHKRPADAVMIDR